MTDASFDAIFLIGPQGSGKGTQGKLLAARLNFFYWGMGEILREEAKLDTDFGKKIKSLIDDGVLLEDDDLEIVLNAKLPKALEERHVIFDGVPRRVGQGEYLIKYLQDHGFKNFMSLHIDVPHDVSVQRLLERAHHEFRQDDTAEKILHRLELYDHDTLPVLELLKTVGPVHTIDGIGSVDEITTRINLALGI